MEPRDRHAQMNRTGNRPGNEPDRPGLHELRRPLAGEPDLARLEQRAIEALETALEVGINTFDHADIYQGGRSEEMFARVPSSTKPIQLLPDCLYYIIEQ